MKEKEISQFKFWEYWINSTPEFVFFKDLKGIYRGVSKATAELCGIGNIYDVIGKNDYEIYPKEIAESFIAQDNEIIKNGKPATIEGWIEHPQKGMILIETLKSPVWDENGNIIGVQGISRDITDNHNLYKKVQEQSSQLQAIFEHIPFALWIKGKDGKYLMVNKEYEEFYDVKKENLINKEVMKTLINNKLATNDTIGKLIDTDMNVIKNKAIVQDEVLMTISGEERYVNITKAPILNKEGDAIGLLGISWDATDQKAYEKLLVDSKIIAEEANRAKSDFLANMSHEIRTPMNGILGFIQLLADTNLDDEQKDFVNETKKSSEILLALLNDILDLSKIEAGKMTMEKISFNIRYVLEDVGTLASSNASEKGLEINVLCYSDIPERVLGDPSRLKQVLNNFVNNAIKFTHEGEINLTAKLLEKNDNKIKLKFEIQDTGIGIPKESQSKIFESFTQADTSTTRKYGGTGLGLTISKNIVRMMNGEISVESQESIGSCFSFTAEFDIDKNEESSYENKKTSIAGTNILLVDDNITNLKVIKHYLKEYKCDIECAIDASEAYEKIKTAKKHFDLVLTDYCMPRINGIDFAMSLKEINDYENTPVILLSSRAQICDCKAVENNNLSGYLAKPIRKNDLIECIMLILNKKDNNTKSKLVTLQTLKEIRLEVKLKILLVEDNPMNQKLITKMLSKLGFSCDIANNGKEAVESFKNNAYDLIFMDCQMPIMDGFEATKAIREFEKYSDTHIPIIALSANAMDADIKKCYDAGMDDYVGKPIKQDFLIKKLSTYTEKKASEIQFNTQIPIYENGNIEFEEISKVLCSELGIDKDDAYELLNDFSSDLKNSIEELEKNIKNGNCKEAFEIAHSIKGAAGNLRINEIFESARDVEMSARANDIEKTSELFSHFKLLAQNLFK